METPYAIAIRYAGHGRYTYVVMDRFRLTTIATFGSMHDAADAAGRLDAEYRRAHANARSSTGSWGGSARASSMSPDL
jgi:hypothetical protein